MKYLSKEPMVFGPPRQALSHDEYVRNKRVKCDHLGRVHVFRGTKWFCHHCGAEIDLA